MNKIDVNTASRDELLGLTGIGGELADAILLRRPFGSLNELIDIPDIGLARLAQLQEQGLFVGVATTEAADMTPQQRLEEVFGPVELDVQEQLAELMAQEETIMAWLASSAENRQAFRSEPLAALAQVVGIPQDWDLQVSLPEVRQAKFRVAVPQPPVSQTTKKFLRALWEHVSASSTNAAAFEQRPIGVTRDLGAAFSPTEVEVVAKAFCHVLGLKYTEPEPEPDPDPEFEATHLGEGSVSESPELLRYLHTIAEVN